MTLFDELAELCIKVQPDDKDPHQWIYAVDDAWLHPEDSDVQIALNGEANNLSACLPVFQYQHGLTPFLPKDVPFTEGNAQVGKIVNLADKAVADKLINFVQEKANDGLLYGVCFCSFEYFWKHVAEIDFPQNAVLFDIRHALGWDGSTINRVDDTLNLGSLRDDWRKLIEGTGMFGSPDANEIMSRLGWYLHYALKFAKVPNQPSDRCSVHSNHVQIVSSAVNPAAGRSDALSDYSAVQQAIWQQLPTDDRITPDLFAFSPMPKDDAMNTGLGVFHNSFKNAADWERIRQWFLNDIAMVYCKTGNGHFDTGDQANDARPAWLWKSWVPSEVKNVSDPLYKNYDEPWILIDDLLRMLSHSGVREFPRQPSGFDNKEVHLSTTPGFVFVFLLIEFIHNLGPKNGRQRPTVKYELREDNGSNPAFVVTVTLLNNGDQELSKCYETGKKSDGNVCGGASKALRALGGKTKLGDYEINNGNGKAKIVTGTVPSVRHEYEGEPKIEFSPPGTIAITLKARDKQ